MAGTTLMPSSSTTGFFQALPVLPPQYTQPKDTRNVSDDKILARILALYLPPTATPVTTSIHNLARRALQPAVLNHGLDAEMNLPTLRPLTTFGEENRNDPLWVTTGWKALKDISHEEGVVAVAYEKQNTEWNRRIHEFALGHVWSHSATMTKCPMSMTDGAATLLSRHLEDADEDQPGRGAVFREAYRRLTSRDPAVAWTSGQWMTERTGGSDVSGTETIARRISHEELELEAKAGRMYDNVGMPLGPWKIDGFKWFSSATDSEMAIMLARTSKGVSAFYAPMRRSVETESSNETETPLTELNGIRIQRLKNKLGTKSLPTAELELKNTRAWLIGEEGQGVKEIAAILNITRLHTAAGAAGGWARGLAICRAYTKVRKVHGALLQDNPQHLRWMADETVKYWAATHHAFFGAALQGAMEQNWEDMVRGTNAEKLIPKDKNEIATLLRLLTPVMKARVSVAAVNGLRECMECLGGIGYCENNEDGGLMNIAKTFRDNLVNPIWEGTVSVMAEDVVRVLVDKRLGNGNVLENTLGSWVRTVLDGCSGMFNEERKAVEHRFNTMVTMVKSADKEKLLYHGRELLEHIEAIVCAALLMYDAGRDNDEAAIAIASRWTRSKTLPGSDVRIKRSPWQKDALVDKKIFLGGSSLTELQPRKLGKL